MEHSTSSKVVSEYELVDDIWTVCCICSTVLISEFKTGYCSNTLCGRSSNVYSFVLGIC